MKTHILLTLVLTAITAAAPGFAAAASPAGDTVNASITDPAIPGANEPEYAPPKEAEAGSFTADEKTPQNLRAETDGMKVILKWDKFEKDGFYYNVYRSTAEAGDFKAINKKLLDKNSFIDSAETSLLPPKNNTAYYYKVTATDTRNETGDSNMAQARPAGPLAPPSGISLVATDKSVILKWAEPVSTGENTLSGYNIFRGTEPSAGRQITKTASAITEYTDLGDGAGLVQKQKYYYWLQSVDSKGFTSPLSAYAAAAPFSGITAPRNVTISAASSESIKVLWDEPGTQGSYELLGYQIYRSTDAAAFPEFPVNERIVRPYPDEAGRLFYYDNVINSNSPPEPGITYYYSVVPIDSGGNTGAANAPVTGKIEFLEIKKQGILSANISEYGLPPDSKLQLTGMKSIALDVSVRIWDEDDPNRERIATTVKIDQPLKLLLSGNIGSKIFVDINYNDNPNAAQNPEDKKISIKYVGEKDETLQELSFGDINFDMPSIRYVRPLASLFGIKGKASIFGDKLTISGAWAQTKGITDIQEFTGTMREKQTNGSPGVTINDINFIANTYYYLTKDVSKVTALNPDHNVSVDGPEIKVQPNSVLVYSDDQAVTSDNANTVITPSGRYHFDRKELGIDYTVDDKNGVVKFNFGVYANTIIAVAYRLTNGESVGYDAAGNFDLTEANFVSATDGKTSNNAHLVKANGNDISHMVMNYYSMGEMQINNPNIDTGFDIKIYDNKNLDQNVPLPSQPGADKYYEIDWNFGIIKFKNFYPFKEGSTGIIYSGPSTIGGHEHDAYNTERASAVSLYRMVFKYKFNISSYRLDYSPVVANSERVYIGPDLMKKERDYSIIYETGDVVFTPAAAARIFPNTNVKIVYEYSPFMQTFENTVLGARLDYDVLDNLKLGATYIRKDSSKGTEPPDARSTELSLSTPYGGYVWDANAAFSLKKEDINYILGSLPLVGKTDLPVDFKFDAEIAYSDLNQNTFDWKGEKGIAMIDNMEGADNERTLTMVDTSWFPASVPSGMQPANRVFTQRSSSEAQGHEKTQSIASGFTPSLVNVLKIAFSGLKGESGKEVWDSLRYNISAVGENMHNYSYLEMWVRVKTDRPIRMNIDIGVISEDSNNNGVFFYNTLNPVGLHDSEDTIPAGQTKPSGYIENGGGINEDIGISAGIYENMPGGNNRAYWGAGNKGVFPDTEDMNNNGILDTSEKFYRYSYAGVAGYTGHQELQFSDRDEWVNIRIPLNQFSDSLGLSLEERTLTNSQFLSLIKHVRLTLLGTGSSPSNGTMEIESIKFVGNSWMLAVPSPGIPDGAGNVIDSPDTAKFDAISVKQSTDSAYEPNLTFFEWQIDEDKKLEEALKIKYTLSSYDMWGGCNPIYYVRKPFGASLGYDYRPYKYLKMDVYYKTRDASAGPGRTMFIRLGQDGADENRNFYQYNEQLDELAARGTGWHTVVFRIDGSDKKRSYPGTADTPNLRQVNIITIGFINPNTQAATEEFYINNIRLTDPEPKRGMAKYASSVLNITGVGALTHMYEDKETDFNSIEDITKSQMRRHVSVNSVRFTPVFLPFLSNFSNAYSRTQEYIEGKYKDDLSYNANNSVPDSDVESYESAFGINQIPGFSFGNSMRYDRRKDIFYGARSNNSNKSDTFNWQPNASWTAPREIFFIPLGSNRFDGNFELKSTDVDYLGNTDAVYYPNWMMTLRQRYRWEGAYDIWKFNITPSYEYILNQGKGNLIGYLTADNYTPRYLVLSRDILPALNIKLLDAWIFSPVVAYSTSYRLDFGSNQLNTTGKLEAYSGLALSRIAGFLPNISKYSFSIDLNETYDNKYDPTAFGKFNALNFERKWNVFLWKMLYDENEMKRLEDISMRGMINISHSVSLDNINFWDILSFNPSGTYSKSRNSSGSTLQDPTESWQLYINSIQVKKITIPGLEFLVKDKTMSASYSFRRDITRSALEIPMTNTKKGAPTKDSGTHSGSVQLFYGLESNDLTGNVLFTINRMDSRARDIVDWSLSMAPSIALNYVLKKQDPFTVWDWVPGIGGKVFKFEQNLNLTFTMGLNFQQSYISQTKVDINTFVTSLSGNYNVLQNLSTTAALSYSIIKDNEHSSLSSQIITLSLGGELNF